MTKERTGQRADLMYGCRCNLSFNFIQAQYITNSLNNESQLASDLPMSRPKCSQLNPGVN